MKKYKLQNYDENKRYNKKDVFVLDDRKRKYDEKKGKFVLPGEPGYEDLPELILETK